MYKVTVYLTNNPNPISFECEDVKVRERGNTLESYEFIGTVRSHNSAPPIYLRISEILSITVGLVPEEDPDGDLRS